MVDETLTKKDNRGRPTEPEIQFVPIHETKIFEDVDGIKRIWIYNRSISKFGPISCETIYPENYTPLGEKFLSKGDMRKQEIEKRKEMRLNKKKAEIKRKEAKKKRKLLKLVKKN